MEPFSLFFFFLLLSWSFLLVFHEFLFVYLQVESLMEKCHEASVGSEGIFMVSVQVMFAFLRLEPKKVESNPSLYLQACVGVAMSLVGVDAEDKRTLTEFFLHRGFPEAFDDIEDAIRQNLPLKSPLTEFEEFLGVLDEHKLLEDQWVKKPVECSGELESRLSRFFGSVRKCYGEVDALWKCFLVLASIAMFSETLAKVNPCTLGKTLARFAVRTIFKADAPVHVILQSTFTQSDSDGSGIVPILRDAYRICQERSTHERLHQKFRAFWCPDDNYFMREPAHTAPPRKRQRVDESTSVTESEHTECPRITTLEPEDIGMPSIFCTW